MNINVFLAEDHDIVRQGIIALLQNDTEIKIVGEANNGQEVLLNMKPPYPHLIIMDMNMPGMNGLECTKRIKKEFPFIKVLVLSMHDHESYLIDMLTAGADGYILKNSSKDELLFAIKKIVSDGIYIGPEFTLSMLAKYKSAVGFSHLSPKMDLQLTDREMDVLQLIAEGLTNTEIAHKLFTSVRTIETRRKNLLNKTGTSNTATLIRFSVLNGIVK